MMNGVPFVTTDGILMPLKSFVDSLDFTPPQRYAVIVLPCLPCLRGAPFFVGIRLSQEGGMCLKGDIGTHSATKNVHR